MTAMVLLQLCRHSSVSSPIQTSLCFASCRGIQASRKCHPSFALALRAAKDDTTSAIDDAADVSEKTTSSKFTSIVAEADAFATRAERSSKRGALARVSLEDELAGLSLEDDTDLDAMMMSKARGGKAKSTSLAFRLTKWFEETSQTFQNPTKVQISYISIFFASFGALIVTAVMLFSVGGVRVQGDGIETARRRAQKLTDPSATFWTTIRDKRRLVTEVEDPSIFMNSQFGALNPQSFYDYSQKTLAEISPEEVEPFLRPQAKTDQDRLPNQTD